MAVKQAYDVVRSVTTVDGDVMLNLYEMFTFLQSLCKNVI